MADAAGLGETWRAFWRDPPGERFARRYQRLHRAGSGRIGRVLRPALGTLLALIGVLFLALPGPGLVPLAIGAALIAGESRRVARLLDRLELKIRRR